VDQSIQNLLSTYPASLASVCSRSSTRWTFASGHIIRALYEPMISVASGARSVSLLLLVVHAPLGQIAVYHHGHTTSSSALVSPSLHHFPVVALVSRFGLPNGCIDQVGKLATERERPLSVLGHISEPTACAYYLPGLRVPRSRSDFIHARIPYVSCSGKR